MQNNGSDSTSTPVKEAMSLSSFLNTNFPRCIPIPLKKEQKSPLYPHKNLFDEELWYKWNANGERHVQQGHPIGLTLRQDLIVFDIDDEAWCEYLKEKFPSFTLTPCCKTKKGAHFYFRRTQQCEALGIYDGARNLKTMRKDCVAGLPYESEGSEAKDDDLLVMPIDTKTVCSTGTGGIIVVPPSQGKEWVRSLVDTPLLDVPSEFIEFYEHHRIAKKTRKVYHANGEAMEIEVQPCPDDRNNKIDGELLKKLVMKLNDNRADNYTDWLYGCFAIYNIAHINDYKRKGNNLIHKFSKRSNKYDEANVDKFIKTFKYKPDGLGLGYLLSCLKVDNPTSFREIWCRLPSSTIDNIKDSGYALVDDIDEAIENLVVEMYDTGLTHDKAARMFCLVNKEYLYVGDNTFYRRNEYGACVPVTPAYQKEVIDATIKEIVSPRITSYTTAVKVHYMQKLHNQEITQKQYEDKMDALGKAYRSMISKLETVAFVNGCYETLKQKTLDIRAKEMMDENHNIVMYTNGLLDLSTMELRKATQDEYVSLCMGGALLKQPKDITPEDFKEAEAIVDDWLDKPEAHYLKKLSASLLLGGNKSHLGHFLRGFGANGKSIYEKAITYSFGTYFGIIPASFYTKQMEDANSPEPAKMKLAGIRCGFCNELTAKVKFISSN